MSKYPDLASLDINPEDENRKKQDKTTEQIQESTAKGEKHFIKYEDDEVLLVNDFIRNLNFKDKINLLFGKDVQAKSAKKEATISDRMAYWAKLFLGLSIMVVVFQLALAGMNASSASRDQSLNNSLTKEEIASQTVQVMTPTLIAKNVEREISLYNNEEASKIQDYLIMRGNRGATMTSIRMQRAKKENTYLYLAQNRPYFEAGDTPEEIAANMEEYTRLEDKIIESIVLSEEALNAFNTTSASTVLQYLLPQYR